MNAANSSKTQSDNLKLVTPPFDRGYSKRQKWIFGSSISGSAIVAISLAIYWFIYLNTHISTDNAYVEADLYPVNARMMGYIKEVLVHENDAVVEGQPLVRLDDTDVQVELKFKQKKYNKAFTDSKRAQRLKASNAISASDLENAEGMLGASAADLEGSRLKLRYTEVLSPVSGSVGKRSAQVGQFIQPGQTLLVIVPKPPYWIKASFKETQLYKIKPGLPVEIAVDAIPGKIYHGRVDSIFPSSGATLSLLPPENATGNFTKIVQRIPVKIVIDEPASELRPGMSVVPTILVR
jgi:membrane fusion protein (multidrug efflux system)